MVHVTMVHGGLGKWRPCCCSSGSFLMQDGPSSGASGALTFRVLIDLDAQNCKGDKEFERWQEVRLNLTYQSTNCQCCNFESLLSARNGRRRSHSSSSPIGCVAGSASRGRGGVGIQSWNLEFI